MADWDSARRNLQQQLTAIAMAEEAEKETARLQRAIAEEQKKLDSITSKIGTGTKILEGNAVKILEQDRDISKNKATLQEQEQKIARLGEEKHQLEEGINELKRKIGVA